MRDHSTMLKTEGDLINRIVELEAALREIASLKDGGGQLAFLYAREIAATVLRNPTQS